MGSRNAPVGKVLARGPIFRAWVSAPFRTTSHEVSSPPGGSTAVPSAPVVASAVAPNSASNNATSAPPTAAPVAMEKTDARSSPDTFFQSTPRSVTWTRAWAAGAGAPGAATPGSGSPVRVRKTIPGSRSPRICDQSSAVSWPTSTAGSGTTSRES
ncbi:hypothetical protein BH23VER1_BH23VER1_20390 [soil metagenome]